MNDSKFLFRCAICGTKKYFLQDEHFIYTHLTRMGDASRGLQHVPLHGMGKDICIDCTKKYVAPPCFEYIETDAKDNETIYKAYYLVHGLYYSHCIPFVYPRTVHTFPDADRKIILEFYSKKERPE